MCVYLYCLVKESWPQTRKQKKPSYSLPLAQVMLFTPQALTWNCRDTLPGVCLMPIQEVTQACLGKSLSYPRALLGDPTLFLPLFAREQYLWPNKACTMKETLHLTATTSVLQSAQAFWGGLSPGNPKCPPASSVHLREYWATCRDGQHGAVWYSYDTQRRVSYKNKVLRQNQ